MPLVALETAAELGRLSGRIAIVGKLVKARASEAVKREVEEDWLK